MIGLIIGIGIVTAVIAMTGYRMLVGPGDADRALASDLLFFAVVALLAMVGTLVGLGPIFDVVLVATVVGFLASLSLSRAITRGRR